MHKLILASIAAFALTGGYANAQGIILGTDHNDKPLWINTWAGQSEDEEYGRRYGGPGSSASTFSGRRSTHSDRRDSDKTDRKYFFVESENRS